MKGTIPRGIFRLVHLPVRIVVHVNETHFIRLNMRARSKKEIVAPILQSLSNLELVE